jgi:F-type H+-transporting ATPase subunit a
VGGFTIPITDSIVGQWVSMAIIIILALMLTGSFKTVPEGRQIWAEYVVETIENLVTDNIGEKYRSYIPFIGTLAIYILIMNLTGFIGINPPTSDYSVTLALGITAFVFIHGVAIKKNGFLHYLGGYAKPYAFMLPLNIIERLVVPVSLSLRLFGNMIAGTIIVELIYRGLAYVTGLINIKIPILQALIPIPFHLYFDAFDGIIQMIIFVMLTMIFTKTTSEH